MLALFKPKKVIDEHSTHRETVAPVPISVPTSVPKKEKVAVEVIKKPTVAEEFSAVHDTILNNAKTIINDEDRGKRLKAIGFHAQAEAERFSTIERDIIRTKEEAAFAEKYDQKYHLRFITKTEVVRLASKYGLVLGPASNFTGDIPEVHLKTMESIKIDGDDQPFYISSISINEMAQSWISKNNEFNNYQVNIVPVQPFHIVSKLKDFNSTNMVVQGNVLMIPDPDPIVLKPILGGYLIVCAWGEEENIL